MCVLQMINISDPEDRMSLEREFPEPDDLFLLAESELFSMGYTTIAQGVTVFCGPDKAM